MYDEIYIYIICINEACLAGQIVNILDGSILQEFLGISTFYSSCLFMFILYISFPFAPPTQQRSQNFFSDFLEQNQF